MKEILIVDMPNSCHGCRFHEVDDDYTVEDVDVCNAYCDVILEEELKEKPKWCPLKPLPQKKEMGMELQGCYDQMFEHNGYNKCIDELLGGKEK